MHGTRSFIKKDHVGYDPGAHLSRNAPATNMTHDDLGPFPPYAFVPGGPWPHPTASPRGHSAGRSHDRGPADRPRTTGPVRPPTSAGSRSSTPAITGRRTRPGKRSGTRTADEGATADVLKGLIKLAAAGVKVRERQPHGIVTHARRAAALFASARATAGTASARPRPRRLDRARPQVADRPARTTPGRRHARLARLRVPIVTQKKTSRSHSG